MAKKLNRAPLETGIQGAILQNRETAEAFTGKRVKDIGPRAMSELVLKKVKKLPNYKLTMIVTNLALHRQGARGYENYSELFNV